MAEGSKSKAGSILSWIVTAVVIAAAVYQLTRPTNDPVKIAQATAEGSAKLYLETAYQVIRGTGAIGDIQNVVTKDDWQWFQDNYESLHKKGDAFSLSSAMDPSQAATLGRIVVMKQVLEHGPYGGCQLLSSKENETDAEFVYRKMDSYGSGQVIYTDCTLRLVKEGKYWKVKDLGGGRAHLENREGRNDHVERSQAEVKAMEAVGPPAAATAGAARPSAPSPQGAKGPPLAAANAHPGQAAPGQSPTAMPALPPPTLAMADQYIASARQFWQVGRFQDAMGAAQKAHDIRSKLLPAGDPRIAEVQAMVDAARKQMAK